MSTDHEREAEELLASMVRTAHADPNIFGLYVAGSRDKGMATPLSDWDAS